MKETNIVGIFPTPIYITNLNRNFSKKEIDFINKTKFDTYKNEGNITSNNTYILNTPIFKKLKQEINLVIKDYFKHFTISQNKYYEKSNFYPSYCGLCFGCYCFINGCRYFNGKFH